MFNRPFLKQGQDGDHQWYLYIIGVIFTIFGIAFFQLPTGYIFRSRLKDKAPELLDNWTKLITDLTYWLEIGFSKNQTLALNLLGFIGGCFGLYLAVRYIHKRSFKSIITVYTSIRWNRILFGMVVWFVITSISQCIDYQLNPDDYIWQFEADKFVWLIVICLTILPFQTSFEELLMRGYLMPPIARLVKIPFISALITGAAFGALHMNNPEVQQYGLETMMVYYVSAGLFLGIMTIMDNGLELALGVHFATNLSAGLFATYEGAALQTPALYRMTELNAQTMSLGFIALAIVYLVICHFTLKWENWNYLISNINKKNV